MTEIIFLVMILFLSNNLGSESKNNIMYKISNENLKKLESINEDIEIVLPKYIPKGFKVDKLEVSKEKESNVASYKISYVNQINNKKYSFYIKGYSGYAVDVVYNNPLKLTTKFGELNMYVDPVLKFPKLIKFNCLFTDWVCYKNSCYTFSSGSGCNHIKVDKKLKRISQTESVKIISSLDFFEMK